MPSDPSPADEPALRRDLGPDTRNRARNLLTMAMGPADEEPPPEPGTTVGDYLLIEELGRGGMGIVFLARDPKGELLALKVLSPSDSATDEADARAEVCRFRAGADAARDLEHPNIVKVLTVGEADGWNFLTMPLIDGTNLARAVATAPLPPRQAASLLAKVARAIHYAHQRGVLHRDLTPANIMLDRQGEPHVTDFGLARRMNQRTGSLASTQGRPGAGNPRYMAPEQVAMDPKNLTVAADIYALGGILFELLTGRVPKEAEGLADVLRQLGSLQSARRTPSLVAGLDPHLKSICRRCLEEAPEARYASADLLAQDLENWLTDKIPRPSVWSRAFSWVSRHPGRTLAAVAVAALAFVWTGVRQQAERDEWATNASFASAQAGMMLYQLREEADRLAKAAEDTGMAQVLASAPAMKQPPPFLASLSHALDADLFVLGNDGFLRAQAPLPSAGGLFGRSFAFRDYFRGAEALGAARRHGAYLARSLRSESDGRFKFGMAAPLFDHGHWVGVLVALKDVSSVFGDVQLVDPASNSQRMTALLGPRDRERTDAPDAPPPPGLTFVVHPALTQPEEHVLGALVPPFPPGFGASAPPGAQFNLRYVRPHKVHHYQDPLPGPGCGRLAAFAPVGETGYVVLVQTRASVSASTTTSGSAKTPKSGS